MLVRACTLVALIVSALPAQDSQYNLRTEVYAGFSTLGFQPGRLSNEGLPRVRLNGVAASATTYQFFPRWGLTAEINAHRNDGSTQQSYLFGGTFRSLERKRFALTGRVLAGVSQWNPASLSPGVYPDQSAFTFGFAQSIDLKISGNVACRVQPGLQFIRVRDGGGQRRIVLNQPLSVGLVINFGRREAIKKFDAPILNSGARETSALSRKGSP